LIFSGKSYNIQNSINKDELVLIPENNLSAIKIKQINKKLLDSLKLLKLRSNQSKQVAFTKELILLDFGQHGAIPVLSQCRISQN
jgi:hypothetical protein